MKKTRIWSLMTCALLFLTTAITPAYGAAAISLSLDDQSLTSDAAPVIQDGRTLVPIRVITENLDCDVNWEQDTKAVTITEGSGSVLKITIGSKEGTKISADGTESTFRLEVPASIINGRTMVPIRAITENLSSAPQIGWSNAQRKVCIYTPDYLAEKGISDVNAYVAAFKAPPAEATGVTDLGTCQVDIWNPIRQCHIVQKGKIHYINAYDYLSQYLAMPSNPTSVKYNKGADYIERIVTAPDMAEQVVGISSYPLTNYLYESKDILETVRYQVGNYSGKETETITTKVRSTIGPNETVDAADIQKYALYNVEGEYTQEDIFNEFFDYSTEVARDQWTKADDYSIESKDTNEFENRTLLNPIILYQSEVYLPMEDGVFSGIAFTLTGSTLRGVVATENTTSNQNNTNVTPPTPAVSMTKISVGDSVYATATFFKCWGTVTELNGTKAKVQWIQVTDMYGFMVKDYMNEMDLYSQLSMSKKGIMIGTSTWVDISILNKK